MPGKLRKYANTHFVMAVLFVLVLLYFGFHNFDTVAETLSKMLGMINEKQSVLDEPEFSYFDQTYQVNFYGKEAFIDMNGMVHRLLGQRSMNERYKQDNGNLANPMADVDVEDVAQALVRLDTEFAELGVDMLFVQAPGDINPADEQLPTGVVDYSNSATDCFVNRLEAESVPVLDLRRNLLQEDFDYYDLFFHTDHHWTPEGGFWAFQQIAEVLDANYGLPIPEYITDPANYEKETYSQIFLGSHGKRTGRYYAGLDDMSLLIPLFETYLSSNIPKQEFSRTGSFRDVMFLMDHMRPDFYNVSCYSTYLGGDSPVSYHENPLAYQKKRVLIIKDSYGLVVIPYFALAFERVEVNDLHQYRETALLDRIAEDPPDLVVFVYNPTALTNPELFRFFE